MDKTNWVDKECHSVEWMTPPQIIKLVQTYFGGVIPLDPATTLTNPTNAQHFYTQETDGLSSFWPSPWFLNPPYGKQFPQWCDKIRAAQTPGIALLPCGARFSTKYFQKLLAHPQLSIVCWINKRVAFIGERGVPVKGNPYDSALYGFGVERARFIDCFSGLGICWEIKPAIPSTG